MLFKSTNVYSSIIYIRDARVAWKSGAKCSVWDRMAEKCLGYAKEEAGE